MKGTNMTISLAVAFFLLGHSVLGEVRLKDVAKVRDQREIQLVGLGLVVGLQGTGDRKTTQFTTRSIGNLLKRMNIEVPTQRINVKNVAQVMATTTVSPYVKKGGTFDVTVSSMGDASSLEGGILLLTIMEDINGQQFGKAQGPVSVGGTNKDFGSPAGVVENEQLTGIVLNGGILEKEIPTLGMDERNVLITLSNPDFTSAFRLSEAINSFFKADLSTSQDAGSIIVQVPDEYSSRSNMVKFIAEIESISFIPDERAKVLINERTGTIVAGGNVSLGPVAITHGTLSLSISPPGAPAQQPALPGQAPAGERIVSLNESANVSELAQALNMLGVTPRDLIAIFQALKRSGSLRADLVIM